VLVIIEFGKSLSLDWLDLVVSWLVVVVIVDDHDYDHDHDGDNR
jgi:hypothetical protein